MTDNETTLIMLALFCAGPLVAFGIILVLRAIFSTSEPSSFSRLPEARAQNHNRRERMSAPQPVYYTENPNRGRGQCQYLVQDGRAPAAVCSPTRQHLLTMAYADGSRELVHVNFEQWEHARLATFAENYEAQVAYDRASAHERGEQEAYAYRQAQYELAANSPYDERTYGYDHSQQDATLAMLQRAVDHDRAHQRDISEYLPRGERAALPSGEDTHVTAAWREIYSELPSGTERASQSSDQLALGDGKDYVPYLTNSSTHEPRLWELENWHEGKKG